MTAPRRHTWTPDDDEALRIAVEACLPLREVLDETDAWWAAVVGRLGLAVTPAAARSRWGRLRQQMAALATATDVTPGIREDADAWERTARQVEEYEATVGERTLETVTETAAVLSALDRRLGRVEAAVLALCAAWGVEAPRV